MIERDIFRKLLADLLKKQVTVITGIRRVGKTTAVKYMLENCKHKNFLYLDCERVEIRILLNRPDYESIKESIELMGIDFSQPCIIAVDEIQLVQNLPSLIKYLYDTYSVKFIVTGSSSYYLKNRFSESLAGRKSIFEMHPLSFREFMQFKNAWKESHQKYSWKPFNITWYDFAKDLYGEYLNYGGFPEVVLQPEKHDKEDMLHDIINSYIELDVKLLSDFGLSEDLYKLINLLAARTGCKVDYSKISSVAGINRNKIASYIQLLEDTHLIYQISPFTKNIDKEISQQKKIYFSDNGIIQVLAGRKISSGQLFENMIATQLINTSMLNYYQRKTGQEIDFILNESTAVEVKQTPLQQDRNLLMQRANSIQISNQILIGHMPPQNDFKDFIWGGAIF